MEVTEVRTEQKNTPPGMRRRPAGGSVPCNYSITRTWAVSDACGIASSRRRQTIWLSNRSSDVCASDLGAVTVQCASQVPVAGTLSATDTCGGTLTATASDGLPRWEGRRVGKEGRSRGGADA